MNRELIDAHVRMLASGMEPFSDQALDAVVKAGAEAVPGLCAHLRDREGNTRPRVTIALMRIGVEAILSELPLLGSVEKVSALQVLAELGRQRATSAVIDELACDIPEVRAAAAATLGRLQDKRALSSLELAARDPDAEVRANALESLGKLGAARATPLMVAALMDRHVAVRRTAVNALAEFSDPAAGNALCAALLDPDVLVRARAALAVGRLERADATPRLLALAQQDHARVRDAAIVALGRCGTAAAIGPLCSILKEDEETQLSTCNALAALAARHPDPRLRAALPELRRLARPWPSAPVRVRAAAAKARDVILGATAGLHNLPMPSRNDVGDPTALPIPGGGSP